jgi:2-keto-4-pentenoate hydratase
VTPEAIERAALTLLAARQGGYKIPDLPADCRPRTVEDGYAIQDALLALLGRPTSGWFLVFTSPSMQKAHRIASPQYGRIPSDFVFASPARIALGRAGESWTLEIELVFRMARDLPARSRPYAEEEVADAVGAMHAGIELVEDHFESMLGVEGPSIVADNSIEGRLVLGPAVESWRSLDLGALEVTLLKNGAPAAYGGGAHVMGHPLKALVWLVNTVSARGRAVAAGETINTGNCLDRYCYGQAGDRVVAECGPLGRAEAELI